MLYYGKLSEKAISMMGATTGKNCMASKYRYSGNSQFDVYNKANVHNLEDFQQTATLGIYEYLLENKCVKGATREQLVKARQAGYKACNSQSRPLAQAEFKHLYIEQYVDDESGSSIVNIVDVTADIHSNGNEVIDLISQYVTSEDLAIIKMLADGLTYETMMKRLDISSTGTMFRKIKKAREHAQKAFNTSQL